MEFFLGLIVGIVAGAFAGAKHNERVNKARADIKEQISNIKDKK